MSKSIPFLFVAAIVVLAARPLNAQQGLGQTLQNLDQTLTALQTSIDGLAASLAESDQTLTELQTSVDSLAASLAESGREYIGVTSVATEPNLGLIGLHELCENDFPGARMCSSADLIRNGRRAGAELPPASSGAWVHPTLVEASPSRSEDAGGQGGNVGNLSCGAWKTASNLLSGLVLTGLFNLSASFSTADCNLSLPVACCAER